MYFDYFGIQESPFSITPDPKYLYLSHRYEEALAHLMYGIGEGGGFVLLTGEVGTGKTTVCRYLLEEIPTGVDLALILNPKVSEVELLATVCDELHIDYPADTDSVKVLIDALNEKLLELNAAGRRPVLLIDEAQNLRPEVLEQIRLLTNLETTKRKLLQIILVGQPELNATLAKPELRQVAQRITARYHLYPLTRNETGAYIAHRLSVADMPIDMFGPGAIAAIHRLTSGIPRLVNVLCDRALLAAFVKNTTKIDRTLVNNAYRDVQGTFKAHKPGQSPWTWALAGGGTVAAAAVAGFFYLNGGAWTPPERQIATAPPAITVVAPAPEPVSTPVNEPAPVAEPVPTPVTDPEPAPMAEPEAVPMAEPEAAPMAEPEAAPMAEPEAIAEPVPAPVAEPETVATPEPEVPPAPEPEPEPEPEPVLVSVAEAVTETIVEPIADPVPEVQPATEPVSEPAAQPEPEIVADAKPEPAIIAEPGPAPIEAEAYPEPTPEPAPEPAAEAEPVAAAPMSVAAKLGVAKNGDLETAFSTLFGHWKLNYGALQGIAPCSRAANVGLLCLQSKTGYTALYKYNRPALMTLKREDGSSVYAVVTKSAEETVTLSVGDDDLNISTADLADLWNGEFMILWKPPPLYRRSLRAGMRGHDITWLKKRLTRISDYKTSEKGNDKFDEKLRQAVLTFQRSHGLATDGVVGPKTLIELNSALGSDNIPLLRDAG